LNLVVLKRHGYSRESIEELKGVFKTIFHSGRIIKHAALQLEKESSRNAEVSYLLNFIKTTYRGISHSCRSARMSAEKSQE
jgi:acyl-[acyl carrier protein]--UDP-N-acetylglucosamine O-acyltransferase